MGERPVVYMVCTGNAARSPMAAAMLRDLDIDDRIDVRSAGILTLEGHPIGTRTRSALARHGLVDHAHRSRQFRSSDAADADLVVVMDVSASMKAAAVRGRIVNVGRLGGMTGEFDFNLHALKRIDYIGVTFRTRSDDEIADIVDRAWTDLGGSIESRAFSLPVHAAFPLDAVANAYAEMRGDAHLGKIVIVP